MNKRLKNYISKTKKTGPINQDDIQDNPDNKIDQDFPGFPFGQAKEKIINPTTTAEKEIADVNNMDGEKRPNSKKGKIDEESSDGSASAFDATEKVRD